MKPCSLSAERAPIASKERTPSTILSISKLILQNPSFAHSCDKGSVSSSRTNMSVDEESEASFTDDREGNRMLDASPAPNVPPLDELIDSKMECNKTGISKDIHDGSITFLDNCRDDIYGKAKPSRVALSPIKMSVTDATAELTASEASADTKFYRSPKEIVDCDAGFDDPPLPDDIPRYIFTRTVKKSSSIEPATQGQTKPSTSKYATLKRLLRRLHRPSHIKEVPCDSDSEVVCSTLISL